MRNLKRCAVLAALAAALVGGLQAANASATGITVEGMHCMGCAKKIAARLQQVSGVAAVRADMPASRLLIDPKPQQNPSPRGMWEAVEQAGYKPTKLEGPSGTFTAKPPS